MERRELLKNTGILTATGLVSTNSISANAANHPDKKSKLALRMAHITDVHIRPGLNAPQKIKNCLEAAIRSSMHHTMM